MTDIETSIVALWRADTFNIVEKIKVFYTPEEKDDGIIRIRPYSEYMLLEIKRADILKLIKNYCVGYIIVHDKDNTSKYKAYYIFPTSGLKGDDLQFFKAALKLYSIKTVSALEIKPLHYIEAKYTSLSKKVKDFSKQSGRKPYQLLIDTLHKRKLIDFIIFVKPKNKKLNVVFPFPTDEAGQRTHKEFLKQFVAVKTPYQFYSHVLIPYHIITQVLFIGSATINKVRVKTDYIKTLVPKSRNLSLKRLVELVNTTGFVSCEKFDKNNLMFNFTETFLNSFKKCRIIKKDLTFILEGVPFAADNLGSMPESIRALLLFLSAIQSRNFLNISMSKFLELTGFSAKSRNVVSNINRIFEYLYNSSIIAYPVKISKTDIKENYNLKVKLK